METSHHRDEIKSASPQRACHILGASGVPCDEAGLLSQPSTQAPCSPPKIWQSWLMGGFQKRPLVILFQLLKFESRYS
jgi:hypothetical protein